jgi:hypothetical protein
MSTSNKKSKPFNRQLYLTILGCILHGTNYLAAIARELQKSPQLVQHYLKVLKRYGYIRPVTERRSYPVLYEVTDKAKIIISNAERMARSGGIRFHHFALRYKVIVDNPSFLPLREGVLLTGNVVEVTRIVDGYTVRRWHSPSCDWLYLYSRSMYGRFPWQLIAAASVELHTLAMLIENRYHLQVKFEGILQKPEMDDPRDPVASFWGKYYGTNVNTPTGNGMDASEGAWAKELSYEDAVDYVLLGRNIAQILLELRTQQALLQKFFSQFLEMMKHSNDESTQRPPNSRLWA